PPPANKVEILGVTPSSLALGELGLSMDISGSGFVSVNSVDLGTGITIVSKDFSDPNHIKLVVSVNKNAAPGPRTITVVTASATAQLAGGINVTSDKAPAPKMVVSPNQGTISSVFTLDASGSTDADGV